MALSTIPSAGITNGGINFRNLIINGDMSIAQRSTSVSSVSGSGYYTVDRYRYAAGSDIVNTLSQSTDVPSGQGFKYSHKQEATTGDASLATNEYHIFQQRLEGYMFQPVKFGTSNAESLTLSFWIKASVTGTYICELDNVDAGPAQSQSYTVSSANTWEKKTITFSGDTSNAISIDNGRGLDLNFWFGAGTNFQSGTLATTWQTSVNANRAVGCTNAFASNNDTVFITGVQLEVGTSASDFEFLPYDVNLQRCMRYYETSYDAVAAGTSGANGTRRFNGCTDGSSNMVWGEKFAVTKRASPTQTFYRDDQTNTTGWAFGSSSPSGTASANNWNNTIHQISAYFTFGSAHNWANGFVQGHWVADAEL